MKIVMIGAGNLATNLGKALLEAGHDILQVYSRKLEHAAELAEQVGGAPTDQLERIVSGADVYIVSVKDSAIADILPALCRGKENKVFVHTAGSMPMDVFQGMALHYGVIYPMQTFSKKKPVDFAGIPCFVEYNDTLAETTVKELAHSLSRHVQHLDSADRKYLHLSAVWACNFVNHCYSVAADILQRHGMDFSVMLPLVDETCRKVHTLAPVDAQTGPAVRFDENVIRAQTQLLKDNPMLKDLYERMSMSIHNFATKKNKP